MAESKLIAQALMETLISPNVSDSNLEAANLVDVGDNIAAALWKLVRTEEQAPTGTIEAHGQAMKEAASIIADAILDLAEAIRQRPPAAPERSA
jgi:hypothetical protein